MSINLNIEDIKPDVISSFVLRDSLNAKLWDGDKLKPEIRKKLLVIAKNFFKDLELEPNVQLKDITLTGSISNYNWSKFSDVDLHLRLDFSQIDDDENFVKNYVLAKKTIWNNKHDIKIYGFPVEVYVENLGDIHVASGLYSILKDEWIVIPKKKELQIDLDDIRSKAEGYLGSVPVLQKMMKDGKYDEVVATVEKIQEKLKRMRSSGLERGGEFSVENLAFKALRRSPFIADILKMKIDSYDKKMSMKGESNLTKELIKPFLTKGELNEVGEKHYWPRTKFPYIKGSGYDSVDRANSTIRSIKSWSKSEQTEIVETMYNRAKYHDTQTGGMREAMEVFEQWLAEDTKKIKKVVGIYGGRYQPFGPHHKKTFEWLKKQVDDAYITTSNIKKPPKHPMNYKEKLRHITKMGISSGEVVNERVPLVANKVLKKYDSETTAVIYIFGEKDAGRLAGGKKKSGGLSYFQDYKKNKNNLKGYEEHGYFMTAPHVSKKVGGKEVSGTVMRELLGSQKYSDEERRKLFKDAFGYFDEGVYLMMHNKFKKLFKWTEEGITEASGGKLIAARNKGHLKNSGETALDANGIISKFKGRGDISDAFSFAVKDLERAIGALSDKQRNKIFMNGKAWMNLEVMWPKSANVINYDKAEIVFHGALEYDDSGNAVGEAKGSGRMLAGMIKQVNKNIQKHYKIGKPNFLTVPKHQDFDKKKKYFVGKLNKLQKTYGLKDNDTLALYHQRFWEEYIGNAEKQFGVKITNKSFKLLVKRWAFFDKSYKVSQIRKDLAKFPKFLDWVLTTDKVDHSKIVKANMKPFEELFFEVGAEIMKNVSGWLAASPDATVQRVKKQLDNAISNVRSGGDLKKLNTLKLQLDKLKSIGGLDSIVPSEGIVFKYNGKTFKFTGAFAPINQITGLMTF